MPKNIQSIFDLSIILRHCSHFNYEAIKPMAEDWHEDLSDKIEDWYDTACYISQMDYVITPDTGIMHLSSSLGIKTKVFLNNDHINDYIKLNESNSTAYPKILTAYWGRKSNY